MQTCDNPLFFRNKIVALRVAILDKCQVYLGERRHMYLRGGHRPSPTVIHPDTPLLSTYETKMAARTGKHSILRSYKKK